MCIFLCLEWGVLMSDIHIWWKTTERERASARWSEFREKPRAASEGDLVDQTEAY